MPEIRAAGAAVGVVGRRRGFVMTSPVYSPCDCAWSGRHSVGVVQICCIR